MSEVMSPLIKRAVEAAEIRHSSVMAEYESIESPSGILNRVGVSRLYGEKYGNDQELIDWRLRMHGMGRMALTDSLVARLEAEQQLHEKEDNIISGELVENPAVKRFDHVDQYLADPEGVHELLEVLHAIEDYANESFTHSEYRQRQNEAYRYFHSLSVQAEVHS